MTTMTVSQIKATMKFARRMYQLYTEVGKLVDAQSARKHMLSLYVQLRATR